MTVLYLAGALGDGLARLLGWLLLAWLLLAVPVGMAVARFIAVTREHDNDEEDR